MIQQLFGWLPDGLEAILAFLATTTGSAGLGIILLTIAIRGALYPLTAKQTRSMLAMKELQPELKKIQEKHKDDPQEYQKRMMALYQEKGVNPFGGCLPLLVQLPFLWSLFAVLRRIDFTALGVNSNFIFWDLTAPDPTYVLPILSGATTFLMSSMTMADQSQKGLTYIMPIFIIWVSLKFEAGLILYWVVSNIFSVLQQYLQQRQNPPVVEGGAKVK